MLRKIGVAVAGLFLSLVFVGSPAQAATGNQTFRILFTANPRSGIPGLVIASGVVSGVGTDLTIAQDPHPDGSETDTDRIALPGGTITILDTDPAGIFHFNPVTCVATLAGTGPYTIIGGTGAYAGASGQGTFTARGLVVFDRTAGGCSEEPRSFFASVTLSGPITVP